MDAMHRLGAACALVLAMTAAQAQQAGGNWHDDCQCYRNIVWGPETWYSVDIGKVLKQDLDFFPAPPDPQGPRPLIIYAHAATATKYISVDRGNLYPVVVQQARANGFSVASIEYRHPVKEDYIEPAPHDDIAEATRWLRAHAGVLGIDPRNVFYLGHSRGTLVLWTALHYQDDPQVRVNAVYGYNAQASYRGREMADQFLIAEDRASFVAAYETRHPQHALFGSALADASPDMPAVLLRYEKPFFRTLVPAELFTEHHPDFGLALCGRPVVRTPRASCTAVDNTSIEHAYDGFVEFFLQHLQP
jgi:acetyl esterase/lipase